MTHEFAISLARVALIAATAVAVVLVLRVPARHWFGAALAYRLWLLVPVALLASFLPAPARSLIPVLQVAPSVPLQAAPIELQAAVADSVMIDWQPVLLALWIAGAVVLFAIFMRQQRRYMRHLGTLSAAGGGTLRAQATEGCPALIGALRPRIVLPSDFESRYSERERELVLAHERTHLARGDAQINAVAALLRCLNWFNPLFHFAASRFRFDQEIACDAAVMSRFPEARRSYADAMLKAQQVGESRQELRLPAGCHWLPSHPLKERIVMLKFPKPTGLRRALASAVLLSLALLTGYASWAAQPARAPTIDNVVASGVDVAAPTMMVQTRFAIRINGASVLDMADIDSGIRQSGWLVTMRTSIDGVMRADGAADTMFNRPGLPWGATAKKGDETWDIEGVSQPLADGAIALNVTVKRNGEIASTPSLIMNDGEPGSVEINDGPARDLKLDFTLHKVEGTWTLKKVADEQGAPVGVQSVLMPNMRQ
jgi:bla regulator protein BlaR1